MYTEYISNHNIGYRECWRVRVETRPGEAEEALTAVGRLLPRCLPLYGIDENTMGCYMGSGCSAVSSNSSGHFKRRVHFDSCRHFHSSREKRNGSERVYVFVASRDITYTITAFRILLCSVCNKSLTMCILQKICMSIADCAKFFYRILFCAIFV